MPGCGHHDTHSDDDAAVSCYLPYKFAITFENSWNDDGYWSEKLFNGLHAHTIPVYFGYDAIGKLFNERRFVNCRVTRKLIERIRSVDYKGVEDSDVLYHMVRDVDGVETQLQKCVDSVIEIDENDDIYRQMLREPVYLNNDFDNSPMSPKVHGQMFKAALHEMQSHLLD